MGRIHHTEPICRVFGYLLPAVANAHLIAAAPDMEKVLDAINDGVEGDNISMPEWLWNDVHAALAKAKGGDTMTEAEAHTGTLAHNGRHRLGDCVAGGVCRQRYTRLEGTPRSTTSQRPSHRRRT